MLFRAGSLTSTETLSAGRNCSFRRDLQLQDASSRYVEIFYNQMYRYT